MAKIITVPNPILREKSKPIEFDKKCQELIKTLKETLTGENGKIIGIGLAAIQIGIPKRVFIAYSEASRKFLTFINPEIIWFSKRLSSKKNQNYEGCLSIPNRWSIVKRPAEIKVRYQTETGQKIVRKFKGQFAKIVQHEYDHLDGILFIDRVLEQGGKIYELKKDKNGKEYLEEIKIN